MKSRFLRGGLAIAAVFSVLATGLSAAERARPPKYGEYNPAHETVELLDAVQEGRVGVKIIPKDSTQSTVVIENKTAEPLNVQFPATFAAVPVVAQFGGAGGFGGGGMGVGGGGGGFGGGLGGGGGRTGGFGGGAQAMGGGMGGMGGMGMFNLPPEKIENFKVPTVCLEHGKKEPNAKIPYEIKPLSAVTDKPAVHELCKGLGEGNLNQRAAQAATWYLENGLSWQELAAKQIRRANGACEPFFSMQEIQQGQFIARVALEQAEQNERSSTSTTSTSDSTGK